MTKKTLVSAITAALVVGAASTTFAAANPFSDVPTDSWAYNAVVTLANDGVIDGFPNGTFQGNKNMTRYEMAQIIARAMAKENMTKADKALVEKLAVEFASELNNLGVRVANLEEKSDNVKLTGKVGYTYTNLNVKKSEIEQSSDNNLLFRLDPTADIGNGWTGHARLDAQLNAGQDQGSTNVTVDRAYVQGPLAGATVTAGKLPAFLAQGLVFDGKLTGGAVVTPVGNATVTAVAGRYKTIDDKDVKAAVDAGLSNRDFTTNVYGAQVDYKLNDKLGVNAGYLTFRGQDAKDVVTHYSAKTKDDQVSSDSWTRDFYGEHTNIWYAGVDAKVAPNLTLTGEYAKASGYNAEKYVLNKKGAEAIKKLNDQAALTADTTVPKAGDVPAHPNPDTTVNKAENFSFEKLDSAQTHAYSVELAYKGAEASDAGSWGAHIAYRHLGVAAFAPTWDDGVKGAKGYAVGVDYVPAKNVVANIKYFNGKAIADKDSKVSKFYGNLEFLF